MQPLLEKQAVAVKQAYDCLTHGLTTVCEIGRFGIQVRDCIEKGVFKGPRVLATGLGFCRTAGHGDSHHCSQLENKESHPWGDQVDGPWDLRKAVRRRLRENPDAIKIWATGGGIWRWDSGRDQHYCSEEIKAVIDEAKICLLYTSVSMRPGMTVLPAASMTSWPSGTSCMAPALSLIHI